MRKTLGTFLASAIFLLGCSDRQAASDSIDSKPVSNKSADPASIEFGPAPSWGAESDLLAVPDNPKGLLFFRRNDVQVHLDDGGQNSFQSLRAKVLDPRALDVGNLALTWNPAAGQPLVHKLSIHRDGTEIDVLESQSFDIISREQLLEQAIINGFLTATLRIDGLRVGDELEWAYTVPSHDPTLNDLNSGLLAVFGAPLPGRHTLRLSWTKGQEPTIKLTDDFASIADKGPAEVFVSLDNPPPTTFPQDAPLRYSWRRLIEYSDFESWTSISQQFYEIFDRASILPFDSKLREEILRISADHQEARARTEAALELVQKKVRYVYVGLGEGSITPSLVDETWQRRYGDCKAKSVLLLAMLRELGVDAELMLVNNSGADDGLNERLPNPFLFDHVVLRATLNDKHYWLDPTLPDVVVPSDRPFLPYRWALPLSEKGDSIEQIGGGPFEIPQEMGMMEYDARAGFDQPAKKIWTTVKRGLVGLTEYSQYTALTPDQLETGLRNSLIGASEWDEIDEVTYRYDRPTQASILTIAGKGSVDWDEKDDGRYYLTLPGGGFNPPKKRQRADEEDKTLPYYSSPTYSCYVTTVRLPDGTDLEKWGFNSTYSTSLFGREYFRSMERRIDRTIRMVRGSRVVKTEISPEQATRDNLKIGEFDNSKARIRFNPNKIAAISNTEIVPATYEFDWINPNAPCLPEVAE